jgi:G3E family GTPase
LYVSFLQAERMLDENYAQHRTQIEADFHPIFGDRRNELVLIGQDMDEAQIRQELTR